MALNRSLSGQSGTVSTLKLKTPGQGADGKLQNPRTHSPATGSGSAPVQDEFMDHYDSEDDDVPMEAGENRPLQKDSSEPHGPKATRVGHEDFGDTEAALDAFEQALAAEANEFCGIDLYKTKFTDPNSPEWKYSAGELAQFFKTTEDQFTMESFKEHKVRMHRELLKLHPDKRQYTFPGISPEKSQRVDNILLNINRALELYELRAKAARQGDVKNTYVQDGFQYFEMPEDGQMGLLQYAVNELQEKFGYGKRGGMLLSFCTISVAKPF